VMTARTTQPRSSKGPLGKRGRCLQGRPGVVPVMGYHAPGHSAGQAACLTAMSCGGGEGDKPTLRAAATFGLVGEPVAAVGGGMSSLICACLQPDWGKPNVRLIGGREEPAPVGFAVRRAAPPAYPTHDPASAEPVDADHAS
jgi:hypothetical protein